MRKLPSYLIWPVFASVLVAVIMLALFPQQNDIPPTVQINQVQAPVKAQSLDPNSGPVSYADAVANAAPAVVNIYTSTKVDNSDNPLLKDPRYEEYYEAEQPQRNKYKTSLGSGVILSQQGYILTNHHVISGADTILVALKDGRETPAEIIGTDPETDLAVLKVKLPELPTVTLASSDEIAVGDVVLAIGNPFGVGQTVTMGIISATGRNQLGINTYENFLQTDAAINPGNSGGALIDAYGNLLGINTAIFSKSGGSQGIGFAIPSNLARVILQEIIENGRVIRGWLGIEVQKMTPRLAETFGMKGSQGLIISGIFRDSPAHRAGMLPGDILISIDNRLIIDSRAAMNQIAQTKPGAAINMDVIRNGQKLTLKVLIGNRPLARPES
ncbi:MAG: trypsin-like peptidase domain-containing protein [Motiliproteus sp.]|nr:trypsin-like peptidase domain-containing protein [Motiliproteus sp.]MCW9051016.1 trypsin-like peptidase domain-containing protein [Motiliproteus sp.]